MNDGGLIAKLEQWFADQLKSLKDGDNDVFKTADVWKHQVAATSSGMEAFTRFAPFAFVSYNSADAAREGGYDLRQVLGFSVLVGVESRQDGLARIGDEDNLGTSKIRDLVITLFDRQHPGSELSCDEIYYVGEVEVFDSPRRHCIQLNFETSYLTPIST